MTCYGILALSVCGASRDQPNVTCTALPAGPQTVRWSVLKPEVLCRCQEGRYVHSLSHAERHSLVAPPGKGRVSVLSKSTEVHITNSQNMWSLLFL